LARVVAYVPDLLFGSNVLGMLRAAGFDASLVSDLAGVADAADVLVVDLTADAAARIAAVAAALPAPGAVKVLAFYSHVEQDVRALADEAGFELVVPRSRLAREGAALVQKLI
jgi:hypothetical protein